MPVQPPSPPSQPSPPSPPSQPSQQGQPGQASQPGHASQPGQVESRRRIHPIWIGAIALAMLTGSLVVLIGYTVFGFAWQKPFGSWNLWVGTGLAVGTVVPLRIWTTSSDKA